MPNNFHWLVRQWKFFSALVVSQKKAAVFPFLLFLPSFFRVPFPPSLFLPSWFHGDINAHVANSRLIGQQHGAFLVRLSSIEPEHTPFVLSAPNDYHLRIERERGNLCMLGRFYHKVCLIERKIAHRKKKHWVTNCILPGPVRAGACAPRPADAAVPEQALLDTVHDVRARAGCILECMINICFFKIEFVCLLTEAAPIC